MHQQRQTGIVKWFDAKRGFGFITPDSGGREIFVHVSDVQGEKSQRTLVDLEPVSYLEMESAKGPKAGAVKRGLG